MQKTLQSNAFYSRNLHLNLQKTLEMKRSVLFSIVFFAIFSSCSEANKPADNSTEKVVEQKQELACVPMQEISYENGNAFQNGQTFSGKVCSHHSNGEMHTLTSYNEGLKEGMWEVFFSNGQREKSGFTRKGEDDGLYREWYNNGELKYEYHYDLGKKVSIWKSWYEDGTRYTERHFENDELNGKVLVWDERGKLSKEYDYVNGRLMNSEMHFKEEGF